MKKNFVFNHQPFNLVKIGLFLLMFLPLAIASASIPGGDCSCTEPAPSASIYSSNSIEVEWPAVLGVAAYEVYFTRKEDGFTSSVSATTGTSIIFSNLTAGTYVFHVRTVCDSSVSGYIITEDIILW